jgi:hypothetical protein
VAAGTISLLPGSGRCLGLVFRPDDVKHFALTLAGGVEIDESVFACRDCGLVWTSTDPQKLSEFMQEHCRQSV